MANLFTKDQWKTAQHFFAGAAAMFFTVFYVCLLVVLELTHWLWGMVMLLVSAIVCIFLSYMFGRLNRLSQS